MATGAILSYIGNIRYCVSGTYYGVWVVKISNKLRGPNTNLLNVDFRGKANSFLVFSKNHVKKIGLMAWMLKGITWFGQINYPYSSVIRPQREFQWTVGDDVDDAEEKEGWGVEDPEKQ